MDDVKYEPSKAGFAAMMMSPKLLAICVAEAERGKAFAEIVSPRSNDGRGRPYADSFDVQPITTTAFRGGPRVGAELSNDAPHAAAVEFGNAHVRRPHRVIGRTAAFLAGR